MKEKQKLKSKIEVAPEDTSEGAVAPWAGLSVWAKSRASLSGLASNSGHSQIYMHVMALLHLTIMMPRAPKQAYSHLQEVLLDMLASPWAAAGAP